MAASTEFEGFAERNEGQNHRNGFKIQFLRHGMDVRTGILTENHADEDVNAIEERSCRTGGNEGIHVGTAVNSRAEPVGEVGVINDDDGNCKDQLYGGITDGVMMGRKERRKGKSDHVSHGDIHHEDSEYSGRDQALFHGGVFFGVIRVGILCFYPFSGGISCIGDSFAEDFVAGDGFVEFDGHGACHKAYGNTVYAGNGGNGAFDRCLTRGARHTGDFEFFCSHGTPFCCVLAEANR